MSSRLVTLGGALLALLLTAALLSPRFAPLRPAAESSRPLSTDIGKRGLAAAARWLGVSGTPTRALRARYDTLATLGLPETGNLLIIGSAPTYPVHASEADYLRDWVDRGNAVLLLHAGASRTDTDDFPSPTQVPQKLGLRAVPVDDTARVCAGVDGLEPEEDHHGGEKVDAPHAKTTIKAKADEPIRSADIVLKPNPADFAYPVLAGVHQAAVEGAVWNRRNLSVSEILFADDKDRLSFVWLCDTARRQAGLSQFRLGNGVVWATSYAELFDNHNLDRADNARLLGNIVSLSLGPAGAVIFDDMHQGDSVLYDAAALFHDARLHASLGFLILIWLVWLLGHDSRFEPPRPSTHGVNATAFARRVGSFYARRLAPIDAAEALLARFHVDVRRRLKRPGAGPAWSWLETLPGIDRKTLEALRAESARIDALRGTTPLLRRKYPHDLRPLAILIHDLRESLP